MMMTNFFLRFGRAISGEDYKKNHCKFSFLVPLFPSFFFFFFFNLMENFSFGLLMATQHISLRWMEKEKRNQMCIWE